MTTTPDTTIVPDQVIVPAGDPRPADTLTIEEVAELRALLDFLRPYLPTLPLVAQMVDQLSANPSMMQRLLLGKMFG